MASKQQDSAIVRAISAAMLKLQYPSNKRGEWHVQGRCGFLDEDHRVDFAGALHMLDIKLLSISPHHFTVRKI